jgi:hypothetical protein
MAAPKGNEFGKDNHEAGRKPLYDNPITLEEKINEYFNGGANKRTIIIGKGENKQSIEIPIITITGLCYFLGFESRQSFYDYEANEAFSYIIKKARLRVEMQYEEMLQMDVSAAGPIFALKNMEWKDKTEVQQNTNVTVNKELEQLLDAWITQK